MRPHPSMVSHRHRGPTGGRAPVGQALAERMGRGVAHDRDPHGPGRQRGGRRRRGRGGRNGRGGRRRGGRGRGGGTGAGRGHDRGAGHGDLGRRRSGCRHRRRQRGGGQHLEVVVGRARDRGDDEGRHPDERDGGRRQHLGLAATGPRPLRTGCSSTRYDTSATASVARSAHHVDQPWSSNTRYSGQWYRYTPYERSPSHTSGDTDRTEATGPGVTAAVTTSATTTAKARRPPTNSGDQSSGTNAKAATTAARAPKPPIVSPADGADPERCSSRASAAPTSSSAARVNVAR